MNDLRLYAIVLRLAALRHGAVPANHGDQARAALMQIIQRGDSPLAQKLHDENTHKPYAISLLKGGKRGADGALNFGDGDHADWRFNLLCDSAFEALLRRYLLNRELPHVRIGAVTFAVVDAFASGISHPDSGFTTITALYERWNCPSETLSREITLDFQSPTAFNLGTDHETKERRFVSTPDARVIFSALRKRWLKLGGTAPDDVFDEWVGHQLFAEPLRLRTHKVIVERTPVVGFAGKVRFRLRGSETRWLPFLHLLADLSFWTGVGYQTTRGMGQMRRVSDGNP